MANVASAEKRNRQRIKRRARNQFHLSTMRTYVKRVRTAIEAKDGKVAELLKAAVAVIDKAASEGRHRQEGRVAQDLAPHQVDQPRRRLSAQARFALVRVKSRINASRIRASSRREDLRFLSAANSAACIRLARAAIEPARLLDDVVDEERRNAERAARSRTCRASCCNSSLRDPQLAHVARQHRHDAHARLARAQHRRQHA